MLHAKENSNGDANDPSGVWNNAVFSTACVIVGLMTIIVAVFLVFGSAVYVRQEVLRYIRSRRPSGEESAAADAKDGDGPEIDEESAAAADAKDGEGSAVVADAKDGEGPVDEESAVRERASSK